jgi:hypothetical protein
MPVKFELVWICCAVDGAVLLEVAKAVYGKMRRKYALTVLEAAYDSFTAQISQHRPLGNGNRFLLDDANFSKWMCRAGTPVKN